MLLARSSDRVLKVDISKEVIDALCHLIDGLLPSLGLLTRDRRLQGGRCQVSAVPVDTEEELVKTP